MRKFFKVLLILLVMLIASPVLAAENTSNIESIDKQINMLVGDMEFSGVQFKKYDNNNVSLVGEIISYRNIDISYYYTIRFYGENNKLIFTYSDNDVAFSGKKDFEYKVYIPESIIVSDIVSYSITAKEGTQVETEKEEYYEPIDNSNISSNSEYHIDKYNIVINVNENNIFDITETIDTQFNILKHGIFRKIPIKNSITRLDGTKYTNRAQIFDVSVNKKYSTSYEGSNYVIKIGDPNVTVSGKQSYTIKYKYNIGKDNSKNYDELYFNLIGPEWDTDIKNVTFTINMPKEFDKTKLGFSSGTLGSTNSDYVTYEIDGNKITGSYNNVLSPGEAFTVRLELPDGYFVNAGLKLNKDIYLLIGIPIICLLFSFFLWSKYGKDEPVVETVEFYPPKGLNSLDVGFIYKGRAENKDVTSLLIGLANKGYIQIIDNKIETKKLNKSVNATEKVSELQKKIEEERRRNPNSPKIKYYQNMLDIYLDIDKPIDYGKYGVSSQVKRLNSKAKFVIRKIKDYDGTNYQERTFMEGLFSYGSIEVTNNDLYNSFYITNNRILQSINNNQNKGKIFNPSSRKMSIWVIVLLFIAIISCVSIITLNHGGTEDLIMTLFLIGFYSIFYGVGIFVPMPLPFKIYWLGFTMVHSAAFFSTTVIGQVIFIEPVYLITTILLIICIIGMICCVKIMPKRTKYGNEMYGKIKGFRNFLEKAEKDRLEAMVTSNPSYFYDILPYTYVLGVSSKWIKKFEDIHLQAPDWYNGSSTFDYVAFSSFINSTMTSAQSAMSSSPSSSGGSSGGGFSGGGSSGGGSGGGGGGSW